MPIVDMPLEKLKVYSGINPRPYDFDAFWNRSLEELYAIDPQAEFLPYDYPSKIARLYDLWFTSMKGARIHGRVAVPKNLTGKAPATLHFHGLSGRCENWKNLLVYASQGFVAVSMDVRGQGGLSEDIGGTSGTTFPTPFMRGIEGEPENLLARDIFLDTAQLARVIMARDDVDDARVGVYGGSQGGGLSVACAALVPKIKLCATTYPYMSDYRRVWNMDLAKGAYDGIRYWFRWFDPLHEREDEIFTKLGYIDIQHLAPRIQAMVLMSTGLMDTTCPPSTQFAMYNKITSPKSVLIYPDFGHEGLNGNDDEVFKFLSTL